MIVNKVITGFVIQKFDTENGICLSQDFIAGVEEWEDTAGNPVDEEYDFSFPLEMQQP